MTHAIAASHPLHRMFRGITEWTFLSELGIGDPGLVGYVSDLLARFVSHEAVWSVRDSGGQRVKGVVAIVAEAESTADDRHRQECHRHVGDLALFWTGVFPEAVPHLAPPGSADRLVDLPEQGKRSYRLASDLGSDAAPVLRRLSDEFELCAFGLSRVRQEWERLDPGPHRGVIGA